jgi:hypothetical protein
VRLPFATRFGRMLDHLDAPSKMVLDPRLSSACVSLIYPQMLKARELFGRSLNELVFDTLYAIWRAARSRNGPSRSISSSYVPL